MPLQTYLNETEKLYHLRLKTIVPLNDDLMDSIERAVMRYEPVAISSPKRTILQRTPLDFPNITAAEVYIVDMTFRLPVAPHVLRAELRKLLDASENFVFVRTRNEPGEVETERLNAVADIEAEAERRGLKHADLLTDAEYSEAEKEAPVLYGNTYNEELLKYLGKVESERQAAIEQAENVPFRWLPLFGQAEKPVEKSLWRSKPDPEVNQHLLGSIDPNEQEVRRAFVDRNGKRVVLTRKLAGEYK